jgi:TorA maturation chaperone TorD
MREIFEHRALIYNLLSKFYLKEADEILLAMLKNFDYEKFDEDTEFDKGFRMLKEAVADFNGFSLLNLAREYARSFFGAGLAKNSGAYPFESVYTSKDHLLRQEAWDEVLQSYSEEMLQRTGDYSEPEDHIAFELEFMSRLCTQAAQAAAEGDTERVCRYLSKQHNFFRDHLSVWAPDFCNDLEKLAKEPFYRAIAVITRGFIAEETETIGELLQECHI